ncbi:Piwi-like protein 1 [Orchesella cincta]|uniref:Piwi-like protein 1 n=1 Tax=Orchesella cincta TaxID=48709 RepID=A0A1D2NFZ4_ORCCI|nr:Piwi-like protein 1 [Orchesella cincta]
MNWSSGNGNPKQRRQEWDCGGWWDERRSVSSQRGSDGEFYGQNEFGPTSDGGNDRRQMNSSSRGDNGRRHEVNSCWMYTGWSTRDDAYGSDERRDGDFVVGYPERFHEHRFSSIHQGGWGGNGPSPGFASESVGWGSGRALPQRGSNVEFYRHSEFGPTLDGGNDRRQMNSSSRGDNGRRHPGRFSSIHQGGRGGSGPSRGIASGSIRRVRNRTRGATKGGRAAQKKNDTENFNLVVTRPQATGGPVMTNQAVIGDARHVNLLANYFEVTRRSHWVVFFYRVDYNPGINRNDIKFSLLKQHVKNLPASMFDGNSLYSTARIFRHRRPLYSKRENTQERVQLRIRFVKPVVLTDSMYRELLNILFKNCWGLMKYQKMGLHFYNRNEAIKMVADRLQILPGLMTSIRIHKNSILLGVELTHKIRHLDNCLKIINNFKHKCDDENDVRNKLVGKTIMTIYNGITYKVDNVDWGKLPTDKFNWRGKQVTFMAYVRKRYQRKTKHRRQPMLVATPVKKYFHRGNMVGSVFLIPEHCRMTEFSEDMRTDHNLMKKVATNCQIEPSKRVMKTKEFVRRLHAVPNLTKELSLWGVKLQPRLVALTGQVIPKEGIILGEGKSEIPNNNYEWNQALKNAYEKAVDDVMSIRKYKDSIQLIFAILPKVATDTYAAVKKQATLKFGIPSQCFVAKRLRIEKILSSICTNMVVQMNAKLGGVPWTVENSIKKLMVVGLDMYHSGNGNADTVSAMVATTCDNLAKCYSTVSKLPKGATLSDKVKIDFDKCLQAYRNINNQLPNRIIVYRSGLRDGQCGDKTELGLMRDKIKSIYKESGQIEPTLTFIVVAKKIITRLFAEDKVGWNNPDPGTVVNDVITYPERCDFYLVSQHCSGMGMVAPSYYNIVYDTSVLGQDELQRFTYKLCHMYFNTCSPITVPAPCQYAHRLALLNSSLGGPVVSDELVSFSINEKLSNLLHFL